ncbi:MAG: hypothetical protein SWZ49_07395 [Cyanobacteriota bacterium]|nr:hypothetical protein [Cyanobacteriota bacterium]
MKKVILTAALTGLFSLSFTDKQGLVLAQSPQIAQIKNTIVAVNKVGLGKIRPGMSEVEVRKILGKPTSTKTEFMPPIEDNTRTLQYPSISVSLVPYPNKPKKFFVYQFVTRSPKFATPMGIKVGDTQSQVIKAYGKPYISKQGKFISLVYGVGSQDNAAGFSFDIEAGKVTKIDYTEQLF